MVPAKNTPRKTTRTAPKVTKPVVTEPVTHKSTKSTYYPTTKVKVQTSKEPIKLVSATDSLRILLDEAPAVPEVTTSTALNQWIDDYSMWKRKVAGSKK